MESESDRVMEGRRERWRVCEREIWWERDRVRDIEGGTWISLQEIVCSYQIITDGS